MSGRVCIASTDQGTGCHESRAPTWTSDAPQADRCGSQALTNAEVCMENRRDSFAKAQLGRDRVEAIVGSEGGF